MQNIKAIVLLIATIGINFIAQAESFEIFNKAKDSIRVTVRGTSFIVAPNSQKSTYIIDDALYTITITNPMNMSKDNTHMFQITRDRDSKQTTYLTWNPAKKPSLYPQTGPLMGLMGKYNPIAGVTKSSKSLRNNITANQIKHIP